jgi:hypothetical protein
MTAAAREITLALAGRRAQRLADGSYLIPCPVPSHGKGRGDRSPSLRIGDGQTRLLVHCYAGCNRLDVLHELRRRDLLIDDVPTFRRRRAHPSDERPWVNEYAHEQRRKASWLWLHHRPISGTPAEKYLRKRGITCPLPPTLGFLPPSKPEHHPAMIAAFGIPDEPEPGELGELRHTCVGSVHLTLIKPDGSGKVDVEKPKLVVGSPSARPIVIGPPNDLLGLAICEGIEDALTAHHATGLGAWAAGAAGFMPKLADAAPSYIEAVTIYAHSDKAGREGARALAAALERRNRDDDDPLDVEILIEGLS